jgi:hypothetical protein
MLTKEEIVAKLAEGKIPDADQKNALRLLLWYGIPGIINENGDERFIYDYECNMRRLEAKIGIQSGDVLYVTNPAIHAALNS